MSDGIDLRFRRSNQTFGTSLSFENDILSLLNNRGDVLSSVNIDLIKKEELPTANEDNLGVIYLYTGPDDEYKHGYFYECVENSGVYSWENIAVQDSYLKNESDNRFVHKIGDETIDGEKTWNEDAHFEKNISATGNLTVGGTTDITGATTIGDKLTTAGDIILENEKNYRYIRFKKSNDDTIHAQISNMYVSNVLSTLNFSSTYNAEKYAQISMTSGKNIKSSVSVTAEENDEATDSTNIGRKQIATQGWVNNPEKSLNVVHRTGDEEISGRKDFLNDITAPNQLDYTNVSNCITEIPQDIKLELDNGTLTLKAGSKLYVPNGTGVFDEITIASDLTATASGNDTRFVFYYNGALGTLPLSQSYSGSSAPTGIQYMLWYDTANNLVKFTTDSGSTWTTNNSLTLGIITTNASQITSIDQVFNGFGYIGSTVFALPGVKGLIPDGRNEDGTLKSVEVVSDSVKTVTHQFKDSSDPIYCSIAPNKQLNLNGLYRYDEKNNICYNGNNIQNDCYFCSYYKNGFTPKTVFHAVDYNDTECMTKGALSNIINGNSNIGNVYYSSAENNTNVYAPNNGKWLILYVSEVEISTANLFLYSDDLIHKVGEIIDGGTQVVKARNGFGAYVSLLRVS